MLGGYDYYVFLSDLKYKVPENHNRPRALKLEKESNGYCPLCGHWSIRTNVENVDTKEKSDYCPVCDTLFDASGLIFIDSQMCKCGHPKNSHEKSVLACKESAHCKCEKYMPTQVTIKEALKQ
jgi:hypothetical protein